MATPGPMADQAFRLGQVTTVIGTVLAIGILHWFEYISLQVAVMAVFLGLPILFIVTSCLLAVWLGYNQEPLVPVVVSEDEWPLQWDEDGPSE